MENIVRKQDEGNKWFITQQEYSGIEITVISSDPAPLKPLSDQYCGRKFVFLD